MPNSKLQHNSFNISDKVFKYLDSIVKKYDGKENVQGLETARNILNKGKVSYAQMKKIKNFFDNYEGDGTDDEYKLMGGKIMQKWVDDTLDISRETIHTVKKVRMDAGEENQFIEKHEKDRDNANPTKVGLPKIHKGSKLRNIMANDTIYEEIKSIKYLIDYMTK